MHCTSFEVLSQVERFTRYVCEYLRSDLPSVLLQKNLEKGWNRRQRTMLLLRNSDRFVGF
jgi:hypothetical protein